MEKIKKQVMGVDKAIIKSVNFLRISIFSSLLVVLICLGFCLYIYENEAGKIFVLDGQGDISSASLKDKKTQLEAEAHNHLNMFYNSFFSFDVVNIEENTEKGLELGGNDVRRLWETYKKKNFYNNVRQNNLIVKSYIDSTFFDLESKPIRALVYGKQEIRSGEYVQMRNLELDCILLEVGRVKDKNPHGFLIEKINIRDNKVLK